MRRRIADPRRLLARFVRDVDGATALEYAVICALLSVVIAGAVTATGTKLYTTLSHVAAKVAAG